jgi:hypothetical protein
VNGTETSEKSACAACGFQILTICSLGTHFSMSVQCALALVLEIVQIQASTQTLPLKALIIARLCSAFLAICL